jgi:type II secretory pathway component GspD/PulD (secretin)
MMHPFHCWHARSVAFLAVVFFTSAHLAYSADLVPQVPTKAAKDSAAAPALLPDVVPPVAEEKDATPPLPKPAAKDAPEAVTPIPEPPRRAEESSRSGGVRPPVEKMAPASGLDLGPSATGGTAASTAPAAPAKVDETAPAKVVKPAAETPAAETTKAATPKPAAAKADAASALRLPGLGLLFPKPDAAKTETAAAKPDAAKPGTVAAKPDAAKKVASKLRFQFRYAVWKEVIEWFSQQAGYSLVIPATFPTGTFNYTDDNREYTPAEALDLLNGYLQLNGFILQPRYNALLVLNLADGFPPGLILTVPVEELDVIKGDSVLANVHFQLKKFMPADIDGEIKTLLGPAGSTVQLPKAQQLSVTDTLARLRVVRDHLKVIDGADPGLQTFHLKNIQVDQALPILRQLLEIPVGEDASPDLTIRIVRVPGANALRISGRADKVNRTVLDIKQLEDQSDPKMMAVGEPQLEIYPLDSLDAETVLKVFQTVLAEEVGVVISADLRGNLYVYARLPQQQIVKNLLEHMKGVGAQKPEVIKLVRVDPANAADAINKLFNGDPKNPSASAPKIQVDAANRWLIIQATESQLLQIHDLLVKMGEPAGDTTPNPHQRTIPMTQADAERINEVLGGVQKLWPSMHPQNKLNIIRDKSLLEDKPADPPKPAAKVTSSGQERAGRLFGARIISVADPGAARSSVDISPPDARSGDEKPAAPVTVTAGPNGLTIESDDPQILDDFEHLLLMAMNEPISVYYLEHSLCTAVAEELEKILTGTVSEPGEGSVAGSSGTPRPLATGPIKLVPEPRLNALIVLANRTDQDTIERLLKTLDLKESPKGTTISPKPQIVELKHAKATEVAEVLRQVYADRMVLSPAQQNRANVAGAGGPLAMIMGGMMGGQGGMLDQGGGGGGRGGRGGGGQQNQQQTNANRLAIGVDTRTNSLIIAASDALFAEVKILVDKLDHAAASDNETVQVVNLHHTSAAAAQRALVAFAGDALQSTGNANTPGTGNRGNNPAGNRGGGGAGFGGMAAPGGFGNFGGGAAPGGFGNFGGGGNNFGGGGGGNRGGGGGGNFGGGGGGRGGAGGGGGGRGGAGGGGVF